MATAALPNRNAHDAVSPFHHMRVVAGSVRNILIDIERVAEDESDIGLEQQAPNIIERLEFAIAQTKLAASKADPDAELARAGVVA